MTTTGKKTPPPKTFEEALASRAQFREAGKRWRERAVIAEADLEKLRGELIAVQLQVQDLAGTITSLTEENAGLREEVESADAEVASLNAQLADLTNNPTQTGGVTLVVSKDGGAALEAITLAQENALAAIEAATQSALAQLGGVTFTDGASTYGDPPMSNEDDEVTVSNDPQDAATDDNSPFDFTFEDDDDDVELAVDDDEDAEDDATVSDNPEEIVAHAQNTRDMGEGSAEGDDGDGEDDFTDDEDVTPPLHPGLEDIDASLTVPNLISLINDTASTLGDTWAEGMATFVQDAMATQNKRLIVREAINLIGDVNQFSESDVAHAQAFANNLEAAEFDTVLTAIITANDSALASVGERVKPA